MAKWVRGNTKEKGCYVCGRDLARFMDGQALVLQGSKGRIAVCSQKCADNYNPDLDLDTADEKQAKEAKGGSKPGAKASKGKKGKSIPSASGEKGVKTPKKSAKAEKPVAKEKPKKKPKPKVK